MKRSRLKSLPLDDLLRLRDSVAAAISRRAVEVRRELEKKLAEIENAGVYRHGEKRYPARLKGWKVAPKYRSPTDRSQTWAGRGAAPKWLRAYLKAGKTLEEFKIKKGRPADRGRPDKKGTGGTGPRRS